MADEVESGTDAPETEAPKADPTREEYDRLAAEKKSADDELAKLRAKDMNFRALRNGQLGELSDEEKDKYLGDKLQELERRQDEIRKSEEKERIDEALDLFAGDDKDLREKALFNYNRITDKAVSRQEINKKMKEAFSLMGNSRAGVPDAFARGAAHYSGGQAREREKPFSESERGEQLRRELRMPSPLESAMSSRLRIRPEFLNQKK